MANAPSKVFVLLFVCVAEVVGQVTTRTVIPRKFRYETACWDQLYGSPVSGWDYYTVSSKEKCQMKCVDAGPTCVAFFWRQTASWCRLNQLKNANRTLNCASWEQVVYAEETTEDSLHFAKPPTICPVSNLPAVANAQHPAVTDPLTVGAVVTYFCDNDYSPAPGSNMMYACNGMGQWSGNATCSENPCMIRGAGGLYGNNPVGGSVVRFNTTEQDESLIITGVKLYCGAHLMAIQMQYNNTWGPKYGEWVPNGCVYPVTHVDTFEFDATEWLNGANVSVISGFPWALTLRTNIRQLPTCGVPSVEPNCERGKKAVGYCGLFRMLVGQASVYLV